MRAGGGDRRRGAGPAMVVHQRRVGHVREDVAVHDQERLFVEPVDRGQRADRAERLAFAEVVDLEAVRIAVAAHGLDQLGQPAGRDRDVLAARRAQLAQHDVQHGAVPDGHQRLGQHRGVGTQAGAGPTRQDDRTFRHPRHPYRPCSLASRSSSPASTPARSSWRRRVPRGAEPLEIVVVDDAPTDPDTATGAGPAGSRGVRVIRQDGESRRRGRRADAGLYATTAPFVFPLDADDLAIPGRS